VILLVFWLNFSFAPPLQDIIPKIVPEVLLCLKDSNGKTREAAYQLILSMANLQSDKTEFFDVIMAALGAQTPHMRSAAVMALSRLVFEYARTDETVYSLLPSLLQTVIILFDEDSREVVKSVIAFVRVSVAALSPEQLEPLLPEVVGGLLKYHKGKDRFRTKIKIILKKLVRHYGYDKLMPLVPETDTRLLTHMRKLSERAARRKAAQREDGHARPVDFDELMESDEEDSDDGRTFMTGATGFTRMTATAGKSVRSAAIDKSQRRSIAASIMASSRSRKSEGGPRLRAEGEGEVMDMLSPKMAKSVHFSDDDSDDSDMDDGMMEFDAVGRLVIHDDREEASREGLKDEEDLDNADESYVSGKKRRLSKFESAKVARDEAQKNKSRKQQVKALGAAYKAKKAGGDVKKKGQKFEPYAYVPLDGKSYSKKNRRATVEQMSTVVRRGGKRKR
jgi:ribosomal RNA-processing protein 12